MANKRPLAFAYGVSLLLNVGFWLGYGHSLRLFRGSPPSAPGEAERLAAVPPMPLGLFVPPPQASSSVSSRKDHSPSERPRVESSASAQTADGGGGQSGLAGAGQSHSLKASGRLPGGTGGTPRPDAQTGIGDAERQAGGVGANAVARPAPGQATAQGRAMSRTAYGGSGAGHSRGGSAGPQSASGGASGQNGPDATGQTPSSLVSPTVSPPRASASAAASLALRKTGVGRKTSTLTGADARDADAADTDSPQDAAKEDAGPSVPPPDDATPRKIVVKVAEVWTPQPGQKFTLPHNLDIQLSPDMKFPHGIRLTPDQMRQIQTLLAQQVNVKVPIDVVRQIYKVALQALQQASRPKPDTPARLHHVSAAPKTASAHPHHALAPHPRPTVAKADSVPRPVNPFHLRPWNVSMLNRFGGTDQSAADHTAPNAPDGARPGGAAQAAGPPTPGTRIASNGVPGGILGTTGAAPANGASPGSSAGNDRLKVGSLNGGGLAGSPAGAAAPDGGQSAGGGMARNDGAPGGLAGGATGVAGDSHTGAAGKGIPGGSASPDGGGPTGASAGNNTLPGMTGGQPGGPSAVNGTPGAGQPGRGPNGGMAGGQPGGGMAGGQPGGNGGAPNGTLGGGSGGANNGMSGQGGAGQPNAKGMANGSGQGNQTDGQMADGAGAATAAGAGGGMGLLDGERDDGENYLAAEHTDTGEVARSEGVMPNLPPEAASNRFNTHPGGLVLPPSPPVGTEAGKAPELHPVAPRPVATVLVKAVRARPSAGAPPMPRAMVTTNREPRRRTPTPYGMPRKIARAPTLKGLTTGSTSRRGTIWLGPPEADRPYLPAGSVTDLVNPPLADGQVHSATTRPRSAPSPRRQAPPPAAILLAVLNIQMPPLPQATEGREANPQRNSHGIKDGSKTPLPVTPLPDSITDLGDGSGLKGEYYTGREFDQKVFTRADKVADFDCHSGESPDPRLEPGTDYTVRWTGKIEAPTSGTYTLYVAVDDGARVWINHELVLDAWISQSAREYSGTYTFEAGKQYDLKIEYLEVDGGSASFRLYWEGPGVPKQFIPQSAFFYPLAGDGAALAKDQAP